MIAFSVMLGSDPVALPKVGTFDFVDPYRTRITRRTGCGLHQRGAVGSSWGFHRVRVKVPPSLSILVTDAHVEAPTRRLCWRVLKMRCCFNRSTARANAWWVVMILALSHCLRRIWWRWFNPT